MLRLRTLWSGMSGGTVDGTTCQALVTERELPVLSLEVRFLFESCDSSLWRSPAQISGLYQRPAARRVRR